MNQDERRRYLIRELLSEDARYREIRVPEDAANQWRLLRSLMNVRMPAPIGAEFLAVQDEFLREEAAAKGIVALSALRLVEPGIYLWQGDITRLACDAIVNAANSGMTGCYAPCHGCIDNCIHSCAGIQLRLKCAELMRAQGREEPTGVAKITPAYNLPCRCVLHTVGPIVSGPLTKAHEAQLASCYRSCLALAQERGLHSVAFCCISTGEFRFPNRRAAEIAVAEVRAFLAKNTDMEVIFNVYKDADLEIYRELLGAN